MKKIDLEIKANTLVDKRNSLTAEISRYWKIIENENVIKKNISEEQIINAALTLYENGWSRIKFYFIAGLPTETLEDMEEMAELLNKIKYRAKLIKREKGLNHGFEITCTLSIFVPKPFTPFQWCPQMDLNKVSEHIHYLKDLIKNIKGIKIK